MSGSLEDSESAPREKGEDTLSRREYPGSSRSGERLGQYVELEVVLRGKETVESGIETAQRLMKHLGISTTT